MNSLDAIQFLEQDHRRARHALEAVAQAGLSKRAGLFKALKRGLELHHQVEESIFYPALRLHARATSFSLRAASAHEAIEEALALLSEARLDSDEWMPAFTLMKNSLLRHIDDEESRLFVIIRKLLSESDLKSLCAKMSFGKLQLEIAAASPQDPSPHSSPSAPALPLLLAFLGGATLGAVLALLYAPQPGRKTRQKIRHFGEHPEDRARELYGKAESGIEEIIGKGGQWIRQSRQFVDKKTHDTTSAPHSARSKR